MKKWLALLVCIVFMVVGCSSSGGGDDENTPVAQKTLTSESGDEIVTLAMDTGFCEENGQYVATLAVAGVDQKKVNKTQKALINLIAKIKTSSQLAVSNDVSIKAVQEEVETVYGSCGGTIVLTCTWDDETDNETTTIVANEFCDDEILGVQLTLDGSLSLVDTVNGNTEQNVITSPGIRLTILEEVEGNLDISLIIDATITSTYDEATGDDSMAMVLTTFTLTDYVEDETITITDGYANTDYDDSAGRTTMDFGATFTDSEGSVTIATTETIVMSEDEYGNDVPIEGAVVVSGNGGSKVRITILEANTVLVEVDTNGDGAYDYDAGCLVCDAPEGLLPL